MILQQQRLTKVHLSEILAELVKKHSEAPLASRSKHRHLRLAISQLQRELEANGNW